MHPGAEARLLRQSNVLPQPGAPIGLVPGLRFSQAQQDLALLTCLLARQLAVHGPLRALVGEVAPPRGDLLLGRLLHWLLSRQLGRLLARSLTRLINHDPSRLPHAAAATSEKSEKQKRKPENRAQ